MKEIKVKCPAKINLNLKITGKRQDGFHNIKSIMQTINLYDYLHIKIEQGTEKQIILSGNNDQIPYDNSNLVYKAAELFLAKINETNHQIDIYIEKNIPISAGLAGGSTDAAGTIFALNNLFNSPLNFDKLHQLCSKLGSDLNVCLQGGKIFATGRGEIINPLPFEEFDVNLIKPMKLGISAKEAYYEYSRKITNGIDLNNKENFANDLEWAIMDKYPQLQYIKEKYPNSIMTGSGSTYFSLQESFEAEKDFLVINKLKTIPTGVEIL